MVEFLEIYLPILINILLIILLIVGIIIGVRIIIILKKTGEVVSNVENKINSLNGFFNALDFTTNKLNLVYDKLGDSIGIILDKIKSFKTKKVREEDEEYE